MTARGTVVVAARTTLVVYAVVLATLLALGAARRQHLEDGAKRVVVAVQSVGHGTLQLDQGFIAAMVLSLLVAPLPIVARAVMSRPTARTAYGLVGIVVLLAVVLAAGSRVLSHTHAVSVLLGSIVGLAFGVLVDLGARSLVALRGHETEGPTGRSRRIALVVTALYIVAVVLIAFHGSPVDAAGDPYLSAVLTVLHRHHLPLWIDYGTVEFSANIVYFVPLGFLVVLLIGVRRWWLPILIGFLASAFIETVQALFLPERTGSVDDVLSNTSGAVLGTLTGIVVLGFLRRRTDLRTLG